MVMRTLSNARLEIQQRLDNQSEPYDLSDRRSNFARILNNSIIEGMTNVLGKSGAESIMINWKLQDCMDKPSVFHNRLFSVLKEPGTGVIERAIVKDLFRAIEERYHESEEAGFENSIHLARRLFLTIGGV